MKFFKCLTWVLGIICCAVIIRQVINSIGNSYIPSFTFDTFFKYLQGFNSDIITSNITGMQSALASFFDTFNNFTFVDALSVLPNLLFMLCNVSFYFLRFLASLVYFVVYLFGFISYLFGGSI